MRERVHKSAAASQCGCVARAVRLSRADLQSKSFGRFLVRREHVSCVQTSCKQTSGAYKAIGMNTMWMFERVRKSMRERCERCCVAGAAPSSAEQRRELVFDARGPDERCVVRYARYDVDNAVTTSSVV
jgi:hypothetical protein